MPSDYRFLTYELIDEGRIARIMLNRPDARNAQNRGLLVELDEAFLRAEADDVDPEAWAGGGNGVEFIDVSDFLFDRIVTETDDADGGGDGGGVDEYLAGSITGSCSTFPGVFFGFAVFLFRHSR